jgi:hypothetical protein
MDETNMILAMGITLSHPQIFFFPQNLIKFPSNFTFRYPQI